MKDTPRWSLVFEQSPAGLLEAVADMRAVSQGEIVISQMIMVVKGVRMAPVVVMTDDGWAASELTKRFGRELRSQVMQDRAIPANL